ncbi:unnamed protein product [Cladocopium goreaui]|uniref:Uncharacterized protein n=1 Tax=Cladocopium goreaui TaxID=2562237 RepID=A0A9P1DCT6_9DINO|nr:unnamed protein product [Cladocopium goreaui]
MYQLLRRASRERHQTRSLPGSRPEVMLRNALAPGPSCRCRDEAQHTEFILKSVARINQTMYEDQMVVPEWSAVVTHEEPDIGFKSAMFETRHRTTGHTIKILAIRGTVMDWNSASFIPNIRDDFKLLWGQEPEAAQMFPRLIRPDPLFRPEAERMALATTHSLGRSTDYMSFMAAATERALARQEVQRGHEPMEFYITGHSLGASAVSIGALRFVLNTHGPINGGNCVIVNFESPGIPDAIWQDVVARADVELVQCLRHQTMEFFGAPNPINTLHQQKLGTCQIRLKVPHNLGNLASVGMCALASIGRGVTIASGVALASAASAAAAGVALASEEVGLLGAGATFAALDRLVGTINFGRWVLAQHSISNCQDTLCKVVWENRLKHRLGYKGEALPHPLRDLCSDAPSIHH